MLVKDVSAACSSPSADLGTSTSTVNVKTSGSYRLWVRIKAPDTTNNSVLVVVDGGNCYKVGDRSISANTWTWIDYKDGSIANKVNINFSAGNHTIKLIGNEPNVQVDKVILTKDQNCIPVNSSDSCTPPPDAIKPIVSISAPTNGSTVSGAVNITANASDNEGVKSVSFLLDGKIINTDTSAPFSYILDSTSISEGTHSLTARATDTSDNVTLSSSINFNVKNTKPDLIITAINWNPTNPDNNDGVLFNATVKNIGKAATPNSTIIGVAFKIDGKTVSFSDTSNTPLLPNQSRIVTASGGPNNSRLWPAISGDYIITAIVDDVFRIEENDDDNNTLSTSITVNSRDTTPPTVSIATPQANSVLKDTVEIVVTANDTGGSSLSRVEFYISGKLVSTDSTSPYTYDWLTEQYPNNQYTVSARAYDSAGNFTNSENISVEVANKQSEPVTIPNPSESTDSPVTIPNLPGSIPVEIITDSLKPIELAGDYDGNNIIDEFDLSVFFLDWKLQTSESLSSDFNNDGVVNIFDLSILLSNWSY